MKKATNWLLAISVFASIIAGIIWLRNVYIEDTVLQNQKQDLAWEREYRYYRLLSDKINILKEVADEFEEQTGKKVEGLVGIELEFQPNVIQWRWEKYSQGSSTEDFDDLNQCVEIAIERIITAQELFKNKALINDHPAFLRALANRGDYTHMAAWGRLVKIMAPFKGKNEEIENLTWADLSAESKAEHQARRDWLKRPH